MSMTRKDYKAIAAAIKAARPTPENWRGLGDLYQAKQYAIDKVQNQIAMYLSETNPRFDRERFANACGDNWIALPASAVNASYPDDDAIETLRTISGPPVA